MYGITLERIFTLTADTLICTKIAMTIDSFKIQSHNKTAFKLRIEESIKCHPSLLNDG